MQQSIYNYDYNLSNSTPASICIDMVELQLGPQS